jgi:hypothetical protein
MNITGARLQYSHSMQPVQRKCNVYRIFPYCIQYAFKIFTSCNQYTFQISSNAADSDHALTLHYIMLYKIYILYQYII